MIVRPFEATDAAAVNAVALAAFAQFEGVYDDWETLARGVGAMADLAASGEVVVAEEAGRIVGAIAYFPPFAQPRADFFAPEWPIVRMLVVDPAARGRGIGRRLTEECLARARRDGAELIALHTSPAMEVALALYLKMGFRLERQVPDRFGVPYGVYLVWIGDTYKYMSPGGARRRVPRRRKRLKRGSKRKLFGESGAAGSGIVSDGVLIAVGDGLGDGPSDSEADPDHVEAAGAALVAPDRRAGAGIHGESGALLASGPVGGAGRAPARERRQAVALVRLARAADDDLARLAGAPAIEPHRRSKLGALPLDQGVGRARLGGGRGRGPEQGRPKRHSRLCHRPRLSASRHALQRQG